MNAPHGPTAHPDPHTDGAADPPTDTQPAAHPGDTADPHTDSQPGQAS